MPIKKIFIVVIFLISLVTGCEKTGCEQNGTTSFPQCIQERINEFKQEIKKDPPVEIWKYIYRGEVVYSISGYCCDIPALVMDENCNGICSPNGGITGNGDGKCPYFFNEAKCGQLVWKDDR